EGRCSAVRTINLAPATFQRFEDSEALNLCQARLGWGISVLLVARLQPTRINLQGVAGADDHGTLHDILQFTDVSWPRVIHQELKCGWGRLFDRLVHLPAEAI